MWYTLSLGDAGSIASLVGFALTIWVAYGVRKLRSIYLFRARVPGLARRLQRHATKLSGHLNDFDSFRDNARDELLSAEVTVQSLRRKLSGQPKAVSKTLAAELRRVNTAQPEAAAVRGVYRQMIYLCEHLKDLQADLQWEK